MLLAASLRTAEIDVGINVSSSAVVRSLDSMHRGCHVPGVRRRAWLGPLSPCGLSLSLGVGFRATLFFLVCRLKDGRAFPAAGARHGIEFNGSRRFRDEMNARQARDGLPPRQRLWAMFVIEIALAMSVLDGAIANIALPTIAAELRADPASAIWVVNAYQLAVTVSLLPFASLGELRGYRRVFGWGLAVFTLGSLACALSDSLSALITSRILQGFGGAGIMSVNSALVRFVYPRDQLGRGVAINALVGATSAAVGRPLRPRSCQSGRGNGCSRSCAARRHRSCANHGRTTADTRCPSPFRLAQRPAECGNVRDADHRYRPYAGRRAVRTTGLRAVRRDVGLLIHCPEPRLCLASFLL